MYSQEIFTQLLFEWPHIWLVCGFKGVRTNISDSNAFHVKMLLNSLHLVMKYLITNELQFDYTVSNKSFSVGIRRAPRRGGPTGQARNDGK